MRCCGVPLLLLGLTTYPMGQARTATDQSNSSFQTTLLPYLKTNCLPCHGAEKPRGDLNLEALSTPESLGKDRATWERVLDKLRTGEMPPKTAKTQPTREEATAIATWLKTEFVALDKLIPPKAGRVTVRRLNRAENN